MKKKMKKRVRKVKRSIKKIIKGRSPSNKSKSSKVNKIKRLAKRKPIKSKEVGVLRSLFQQI